MIATWDIDWSNSRSLNNWVQQLDLMCEPDWKGGFIGTAFYFFWCLSLLYVPRQADKVGRRWLFLGSRIAECLLFIGTLVTTDYWVMVALLIGFGVAAAGRINVGTVYLTEWLPRKTQTVVHVIHHSGQALSYVLYTLFFWLLSSETMLVSGFGCAVCIVTTILACFIPESPRLLCAKGRVAELQKSINTMAWFNRKTVTWTEQELKWIEENAATEAKKGDTSDKRGGVLMAKWFTADVLVSGTHEIAISNLPPETDEPALIRMLTSRGMKDSDLKVEMQNSNSTKVSNAKRTLKKKLSFSVSFKSQAEMLAAIKMLKSSKLDDGYNFEVRAAMPAGPDAGEAEHAPEILDDVAVEELSQDHGSNGAAVDDFAAGSHQTPSTGGSDRGEHPNSSPQQFVDTESLSRGSSASSGREIRPALPEQPEPVSQPEAVAEAAPEAEAEEEIDDQSHMEVTNFQRRYFCRNFVLMTTVQITCLFNFHLLAYLTNLFEQVYVTGIMAVSSEFVAYLVAGYVLEKLGAKVSLMTCYTIAGVGGVLMLTYGLHHTDSIAFPIIFLVCRFGVAGVYILFIAANARIFDVEKSATAFGLGSFFARMVLSGAPLVSTM